MELKKQISHGRTKNHERIGKQIRRQMSGLDYRRLDCVGSRPVFMTLYQGSITTIWNSIVTKITGLLS
jgi:hypothetical protein